MKYKIDPDLNIYTNYHVTLKPASGDFPPQQKLDKVASLIADPP